MNMLRLMTIKTIEEYTIGAFNIFYRGHRPSFRDPKTLYATAAFNVRQHAAREHSLVAASVHIELRQRLEYIKLDCGLLQL